jgi:anti-anti-sigma factor
MEESHDLRWTPRVLCVVGDPDDEAGRPMLEVYVCAIPRRPGTDAVGAMVALVGEFCAFSAGQTGSALRSFVEYAGDVVVDLTGLTFVDAAGLDVLVGLIDGSHESGGSVTFENANARIGKTFELAGLAGVLGSNPNSRHAVGS